MIKLNSYQISNTLDCQKENMILAPSGYPLIAWIASGILNVRLSKNSVWYPKETTLGSPTTDVKMGLSNDNYLLFYLEDGDLKCIEYSFSNILFYNPVTVASGVTLFDVTRNSSLIKVAYTKSGKIYTAGRNNDSRVWDAGTEIVSEGSDITSVSVDYQASQLVVAYTTSSKLSVYQNPETFAFTPIASVGLSDVVVRMLELDEFDLVYNLLSGNRSIEHVKLSSGSYTQDQIVDATNDNYNLDLFVSADKICVVWVEGGHVRYREWNGVSWDDLVGAAYIDYNGCDVDSTPKVIFLDDYSRVVYKKSSNIFYAGMTPVSQNMTAYFNCALWGESKPIENENTSISSALVKNSLCQRIRFQQQSLSIGGVSCYLKKKKNDANLPFTLIMDIYYSDINGKPYANPIASSSISSSSISGDAWYEFPFALEDMLTPIDGYCFVVYQTGGDESNYAGWYFYVTGETDSLISNDRIAWVPITGITRSLKVRGSFNAYEKIINVDPLKITNQLISPPAIESIGNQLEYSDLMSGIFDNTELIDVKEPTYYEYPVDQDARIYGYAGISTDWRVVIENKNLVLGFVLDSSGSMGWNDIFDLRKSVANSLIAKLRTRTGANILFDFVKFGGVLIDDITVSLTPHVHGVIVDITNTTAVYGFDADGNPIVDDGNPKGHLATGVVAFGYKGLKTGTTYQMLGMDLGWYKFTHDSVENNWHSFWASGSPSFSLVANGPENETILNVEATDGAKETIRYYSAYYDTMYRTTMTSPFATTDYDIVVADTTGFSVGGRLNVVTPNYINNYFLIDNVNIMSNAVTCHQKSNYNMATVNTVVETVRSQFVQSNWENTNAIEFFVVDEQELGAISFFIQTFDGATLEYEFIPLASWELSNLYFLDETATFEINAINSKGENMPDGTMVEFYVNLAPDRFEEQDTQDQQQSYYLTQDALSGTTVLYLAAADIALFKIGDKIEIKDNDKSYFKPSGSGGVAYTYIVEVNIDNNFLVVSDPLSDDFYVSKDAQVVYPATETEENKLELKSKLNINANVVDVTPIYTGRKLDSSYFNNMDTHQVEPTDDYDAHNFDFEYVRRNSIDLLTTNSYASVRLLPITEDHFLSAEFKEALSKSLFNLSAREQVDEIERQKARGEIETTETTTSTTTTLEEEKAKKYYADPLDFIMEHTVYIYSGYASTTMKSYAWELEESTINGKKYLLKPYNIYTVMSFFKTNGDMIAQLLIDPFEVDFASPYRITSEVTQTTTFQCEETVDGETTIVPYTVCGDYATAGRDITITYKVDKKDFPMTTGQLEVYIYDARRDKNSANALDEDLGDVSGCGDTESAYGGSMVYSATAPDGTVSSYDDDVANMLLADGYLSSYGVLTRQSISVINGIATLTLPALNRIAQLQIHAIYIIDNKTKLVHKQDVYYRSPLVITYTGPRNLVADGNATYELSAFLSWMEIDMVDDGTIVNFEADGGNLNPSMSETVNSIADGVIYKPDMQDASASTDDQSFQQSMADQLASSEENITKTVYVSSSYRGFFSKISATLELKESDDTVGDFYYICKPSYPTDQDKLFTDGVDYSVLVADLQESWTRGFPFIDILQPSLIGPPEGMICTATGFVREPMLSKWSVVEPAEGIFSPEDPLDPMPGWASYRMRCSKYVGRPILRPPSEDDGPPPCDSPECVEVNSYTNSRKYKAYGIGIDSYTVSFISSTASGSEKIPKPRIEMKEPLGIDVSIEPIDRSEYNLVTWRETPLGSHPVTYSLDEYSHPIRRDGKSNYYIVAEVTWKDGFVIGSDQNPLPKIGLKAGKIEIKSDGNSYSYIFTEDDDFKLEVKEAEISIARTTFDENHFHECYVDNNGTGKTTATIAYVKGTTVSDHVHIITITSSDTKPPSWTAVVSEEVYTGTVTDDDGNVSSVSVLHTHTPRSVAIVQGGPVLDMDLEVVVQGYVEYDNSATETARNLDNYAFAYPADVSGGESEVFEEQYFLEIITPKTKVGDKIISSFLTEDSKDVDGQLIVYHAWKVDVNGNELPLPDGTRIFTSFKFFEPENQEQMTTDEVLVIQQEKLRDYAVMEINARLSGLPVEVTASQQVLIKSNKNWFPYVDNPVFDEPTNDDIYIAEFLDTVTEFGASQINDGLIMMSNRMIQLGEDYSDWAKVIILISDGSENMSENSHSQATDCVDSINDNDNTPVFTVKLFDTEPFDNIAMQKYSQNTGGESFKIGQIVESVETTSESIANKILSSDKFSILTGVYSNIIDLGEMKVYKGLRFGINMKPGTVMKFRVRFSSDGITYGAYTDLPSKSYTLPPGDQLQWYIVDFSSIDAFARYMEYEITLKGSISSFASPRFAGVRYEYYEPGRYVMFMQPIEITEADRYVGEIMMVHEGTIPETSEVKYGITHDSSTDYDLYYYSETQPKFNGGTSGIVLSRFNEKTTTIDYKTYFALNGGWNEAYEIKVYKINVSNLRGILVPLDDYVIDSKSGSITFNSVQPILDQITFAVTMKPYFRVSLEMKNYTSDTIILDNVSFAYNLVDRKDFADADDHRDVTSKVKTDHSMYKVVSSGTLQSDYSVGASNVGKDTDISIDSELFQDKIYYLLHNGTEPYMAVLETNMTFVVNKTLPGNPSFVPVSFSYDDGFWYFVERSGSGCIVHKYTQNFTFVDSFAYTVDFLQTDAMFLNVRRSGNLWYVSESDRIHVLNQAFNLGKSLLLPSDISGPFDVSGGELFFVSIMRDLLWVLGSDGLVTGYYDFLETQIINNISYLNKTFFTTDDKKLSRLKV